MIFKYRLMEGGERGVGRMVKRGWGAGAGGCFSCFSSLFFSLFFFLVSFK